MLDLNDGNDLALGPKSDAILDNDSCKIARLTSANYFPLNMGFLFSRKAFSPSLKS
jgi:hypothetical protein